MNETWGSDVTDVHINGFIEAEVFSADCDSKNNGRRINYLTEVTAFRQVLKGLECIGRYFVGESLTEDFVNLVCRRMDNLALKIFQSRARENGQEENILELVDIVQVAIVSGQWDTQLVQKNWILLFLSCKCILDEKVRKGVVGEVVFLKIVLDKKSGNIGGYDVNGDEDW